MPTETAPKRLLKEFFDRDTREGRKRIVTAIGYYLAAWVVTAVLLGIFVNPVLIPILLVTCLFIGHLILAMIIMIGYLIHEAVTDWLDG